VKNSEFRKKNFWNNYREFT